MAKDIRNAFSLEQENDTAIRDIRNIFKLKEEHKANKNRIIWDIRNLFECEEEQQNCYQPVRVGNFCSINHTEYKSNCDRNKTPWVE